MPNSEHTSMILIIEDNHSNELLLLSHARKNSTYFNQIKIARTVESADLFLKEKPSVIFINACLKGIDNEHFFKTVKEKSYGATLIILLDKKKKLQESSYINQADDILYIPEITPVLFEKTIYYALNKNKKRALLHNILERYSLLAKATKNIVWDWDIEKGGLYFAGNGLVEILGYEEAEMWTDIDFWKMNIHPDDREKVLTHLNIILQNRSQTNWEDKYRYKKKDGTYVYIFDRGYIILKNGVPIRMTGSMEDISEKRAAEILRRSTEKKYKNLFDKNPLATFIWNRKNFKMLDVNETALKEYGYTLEEFLHLTIFDLRPVEDIEMFKKTLATVLDEKKKKHEYVWLHKNKSGDLMQMQVYSYKIHYNGEMAVMALAKNITEEAELQKKLEQEKVVRDKQITEAVVSAQENERKGIAEELHDNVNQLLSASRFYIEAAKTDGSNSATLLSQASEYIMTAIEAIRTLSKTLNTPLIHDIDFTEAVQNLADDLMIVNEIKIEINKKDFFEDGLHENFKLTLFRIIQEQITNILKHAQASAVIISLISNSREIILKIEDNGVGFDTKKKSTGIGLQNIYSRAQLYNGLVNILSEKNKGTSLQINFPIEYTQENETEKI